MEDCLKKLADSFSRAMKYDYIYTLGDKRKNIKISIVSNKKGNFTHVFGLDHLKESPIVIGNNLKQKEKIFSNIVNKKITMNDIEQDPNLNSPIEKTWNELEKRPYTIYDRLVLLENFDKILDESGGGKIYPWNNSNCQVITNKGVTRMVKIEADYVLTIPTKRSDNEKYYFFLYLDTKRNTTPDEISLVVHSAFVDCCDLVSGQQSKYTILKLDKRARNKKIENLYIHPNYKEEQ